MTRFRSNRIAVVGRTLSHYRIVEKLGEGGMGVVYKAHDTHLDRTVAIKLLPPAKVTNADRKQRFIREAKSASALNHPNIVTIHEIRTDGETDFIVMEHVEGRPLDKMIAATPLRPSQVLKFAVQIADALAKAHSAGIVHRDLKPSNIMIATDGRVKVLDFGLAKLIERPHTSPDDTTVTAGSITEEGTAVGTAAYMSPEQAEGRKLDGRSDIFSFGAVLYQMSTGRRPFSGDSTISILAKILNEDPTPPAQITGSITPDLEKIILRCLRKDPERRYQTMADLKVALEDTLVDSSTGARVQPIPLRRRWAWAALAPIILLVGYAAWRVWRPPQAAQPLRATTLTTFAGIERSPSLSPDGNHVVFTWTGPKRDNENIYVQQIGSGSPLQLTTDPADDYNPVWSPDGKLIAFLRSHGTAPTGRRDRELRLIAPLGGNERKLADVSSQDFYPYGTYLAWSPDSKSLVVTDSPGEGKPDALFVISIETGGKRQLTSPQPPALADTSPALSSDGRRLVFVHRKTLGSGELHVLALGNGLSVAGESKRLTSAELRAEYPTWMPNGREVVFSAKGSLWRLGISGAETPTRIPYVGEDGLMPAISRPELGKPARMVYVRSFVDFNFWRIDTSATGAPSQSAQVPAISSTKTEYHIRFSPDGRRVAFTSARSGDPEIWLSDPDGSNAIQLTSMAAHDTMCPYWSPDGRFIAFSSDGEGEFDIYTDLAVSELADRGHSRYIRRRFTIPAWRASQRAWAAPLLARLLVRAQVLADTFHSRWAKGIPAANLKSAMAAAKLHETELLYLLDGYNGNSEAFPNGLLEPLAVGSGRIMADRHARNLVLVVDVGAGTTDFSLFWSVQGPKGRKAFPVEPCGDAVRVAGDILDEILIAELLKRADGGSGDWMRKRFETEIRHGGIRRMKETLFLTGRLDLTVADQSVSIELEEFLDNERVRRFGLTIEEAIRKFLSSVDSTWQKADQALLVLTGGGASLPMIKDLVSKRWELGGRSLTFKPAEAVPEAIQEFDADFQREYPQLAVAIGGALPVLDERFIIREFAGAATKPGPLERIQVTGV